MFDKRENYRVALELATGGFVLLKNEDRTLPFCPEDRVGVLGHNSLHLIKGGGGSADVTSEYVSSLVQGLSEQAQAGRVCFSAALDAQGEGRHTYTVEELNELARRYDKFLFTFTRYSDEGNDRTPRDYALSETEQSFLDCLEASQIKKAVVVLNVASLMDVSFLERYKTVSAALLVFLPGMEGGRAIARVLCGETCPDGRLADTVARRYEDYPAAESFDAEPLTTRYKEGLYVGYRYFETFHPEQVLFPFGFGLSYTSFAFRDLTLEETDDTIRAGVTVCNTGSCAGRQVVQLYVTKPTDCLPGCAVELVGYEKTPTLQPGARTRVTVTLPKDDLACFDTDGVTGFPRSFVLPKGRYTLWCGQNARDRVVWGSWQEQKTRPVQACPTRLDGTTVDYAAPEPIPQTGNRGIMLRDVASGKADMDAFIGQLTTEEMAGMALGQCPRFALGTAGIGDLPRYGIPNPQTADGPAGVRRSIPTTCFPCATLIACSFDPALQQAMGRAMGTEGLQCGVDVLLAPSMNLHRHVLCGRNFEYFSEDPLVSGRAAAALVRGIQQTGLLATVKHFVANNREYRRHDNNSLVEERALRELYLKGFKIVIKEADPAFVMTSYNLLNGVHTGSYPALLQGVLREEWGYTGCVMTDWRTHSHLEEEVAAGNNIKMPLGYPDEVARLIKAVECGRLPLGRLQQNTRYILEAVMKTRSFKEQDFGPCHTVGDRTVIPATRFNGLSSTRIHQGTTPDGMDYLYRLGLDQRGQNTFVFYTLDVVAAGRYRLDVTLSHHAPGGFLCYETDDGTPLATLALTGEEGVMQTLSATPDLPAGACRIKVTFAATGRDDLPFSDYCALMPEDVCFGTQVLTRMPETE